MPVSELVKAKEIAVRAVDARFQVQPPMIAWYVLSLPYCSSVLMLHCMKEYAGELAGPGKPYI